MKGGSFSRLLSGSTFLLAAACAVAAADGFRTPSDNIHCLAERWDGAAELRCDIRSNDAEIPARPSDCDLDWGSSFVVSDAPRPSIRGCAGDTVIDPASPILHYGSKWEQHGFVCTIETSGVACGNRHGNGFTLSRKRQTLQ